jgi:hypothetical protein
MTLRSWIRRLFTRRVTRTARKAPARWAPPALSLERLEDRLAPATLTEANGGTTLAITLDNANEALGIVSNGATYSFSSTNNFADGGVTNTADFSAFGTTTLNLLAAGLTRYSAIRVADGAAGTAVSFNDSGANAYSDAFRVVLDNGSNGVTFNGSSSFGANALRVQTDRDIRVNGGATVSTSNGGITFEANLQAAAAAGDFSGVLVAGTVTSTGTGNLVFRGRGGNDAATPFHSGVAVIFGGVVSSTGTGGITVVGTGGTGAYSNHGVEVSSGSGSLITSVSGAIDITGTGGSGGFGNGVIVFTGGKITSTGTGATAATITINGTGGVGGNRNEGIDVEVAGSAITTVDGDVSLVATPGANSGPFALFGGGSISSTGAGDVELSAAAGDLITFAPISAPGATVRLTADAGSITQDAAGLITAASLGAAASGAVSLGQPNTVTGVFAANAGSGGLTFNSTASFSVGSVSAGGHFSGATGVMTADGAIDLTATTGDLTVGAGVTAGGLGRDVRLTAFNDVTITDVNVTVNAISGNLTLQAGNDLTIAGALVAANGTISLLGDVASTDPGTGTTITVSGAAVLTSANPVQVKGGGDSDTFNIAPQKHAKLNVTGGAPTTPAMPGDTLHVDLTGVTTPALTGTFDPSTSFSGQYTFGNREAVSFDTIETVDPMTDLVVGLSGTPNPVVVGTDLTFEITLNNTSQLLAESVLASMNVPAGTTFQSFVQLTGPAFTLESPPVGGMGTVTAKIKTLDALAAATFRLVVRVEPATPGGPVVGTVTVTTSSPESDTADNKATVTRTVDRASPTFSALASPGIVYGAATATLSGHLGAGGVHPPQGATVSVTLDGVTRTATLDDNGDFSAAFDTAALGAGDHAVAYAYAGDGNFNAATGSGTLSVSRATPTVTWANPAAIAYGTPLGDTQLNATADVPGTFTYTPAAGTVLSAGTHTLDVTFTPADTANHTSASATVTLIVDRATPTVTWADPAAIVYGTALSAAQFNATADVDGVEVSGTFSYSLADGTVVNVGSVLNAGSHQLKVDFTSSDTANYNTPDSVSVTLTVDKADPTITWPTPGPITYGTPLSAIDLNAPAVTLRDASFETPESPFTSPPATNPLFWYNPTGSPWTFSGTTDNGSGVSANNSGFTNGNPGAPEGTQVAFIQRTGSIRQSLDLAAGFYTVSFLAAQRGNQASTQEIQVLIDGKEVGRFTPSGTDYVAYTTGVFTVTAGEHTLLFQGLNPRGGDNTAFLDKVVIAPGVAGAFAFNQPSGAVLDAGTHTLSVTFTPTDAANYNSASADVTLTVDKATPTVTLLDDVALYDQQAHALSATVSGLGGVSVAGSLAFTYNGVSSPPVNAGTYTVTVEFRSNDPNYSDAEATGNLVIHPATPTVTVTGGTFTHDQQAHTATASATGVGGGPVRGSFTFTYDGSATPPTNVGTYAVQATFTSADSNYAAATGTATLTINPATPTVTVTGGPFPYDSNAHAATATATGVGGSPVAGTLTLTYDGAPSAPANAGSYTVRAHFQSADPNYADADSPAGTLVINPAPPTTVGVFEYNTATWKLRNSNSPGAPDVAPFAYGSPTSAPVWGDWDGDGSFTVGVVDVVPNPYVPGSLPLLRWQLKNSNPAGAPDVTFLYGKQGDIPVVGDWDGDGTFTVGIFEPDTGVWKLKNTNQEGAPDYTFAYGQRGDTPVVGDWDGDGTFTVGVARAGAGVLTWYLRNANTPGAPDIAPFAYGSAGTTPVVGDWDGDRVTTVGAFDPASATWRLRDSNTAGAPDVAPFAYGDWPNRSRPVLGAYGPGALLQAAGGAASGEAQAAPLSPQALDGVVQAALTRLHEAGVRDAVLNRLGLAHGEVADLPGAELAQALPASGAVLLDRTAAGHGWFVDPTPLTDEEFDAWGRALAGGPAAGRMDLVTAVLHGLGHLAGLPDVSAATDPADLMGDPLADGVRRTAALDQVFAQSAF